MKYLGLIRGSLFLAIGLYLIVSPMEGKVTMSYVFGATALAYGCMRTYMAYQQLYGPKKDNSGQ
jgi:uncharacterized membrane protein HdeD (DUF308 family)